jgi:hypothetical protein
MSLPWVAGLVGRKAALILLEAELDRPRFGELRCVVLPGEPSFGKARLVRELTERDGVPSRSVRADRSGATTPFGLWSEAFERHLRGLDGQRVMELVWCPAAGDHDRVEGVGRSLLDLDVRPRHKGVLAVHRAWSARQ